MSFNLTHFTILGLHGKLNISIPIVNNRLVLIGVNGLGKTTVVNFLYYVLTEQWLRLLEYEFSAVEVTINEQHIALTKNDIALKSKAVERQQKILAQYATRSPFPSRFIQALLDHPDYLKVVQLEASSTRERAARQLARELQMPSSYLLRMLDDMPKSMQPSLFENRTDPEPIVQFSNLLRSTGTHQVIYLPTYRRIEQDLKAVFPYVDDEQLRRLTSAADGDSKSRSRGHIELVHFGMQDVEKKIAEELETIQRQMRAQLSNLTASYLQDIIRNRADAIEPELVKLMSDDVVSIVLSRVEENTLSPDDKREVESAIRRLRSGATHPAARDRYLTYFFSRLLDIYQGLSSSEANIRHLFDTCNRYLERKRLHYDDAAFSAHILEKDGSELNWRVLSSGEKQIVSLFTHLFLSGGKSQIVLIDEPELSLSVPWQKHLLPDISKSKNCELLIAVTHSPFIYANELDEYAVDLSRFTGYQSTFTQ